jgi:antitoxin component YwqK of YwqJK toxin-antitoxin module
MKQSNYKALRVKKINETAILPNGERQPNVLQWTSVSPKADTSIQYRSVEGVTSKTISIYHSQTGKLIRQLEMEEGMRNEKIYSYHADGMINRIESVFIDSLMDFKDREIHVWSFDQNDLPKSMWRIVEQFDGSIDSTFVAFIADGEGRVTEETTYRKGKKTGFYYYYYNDRGLLIDVVKYNEKWKRLLPDLMMEYDLAGKNIEKRQLIGNRDISYLIWRYEYEKEGLLKEEALYNSQKQRSGSIIFNYEFYQK